MKRVLSWLLLSAALAFSLPAAAPLEPKPSDPYFAKFFPVKTPRPQGLILRKGDRLAICGDSITEQKMYSRIMESYLTVCVPELGITVRQFGWSGERAPGFLARMTNDCLRFHPTLATTCYGMNDHEYRPYQERIGRIYREKSAAIVEAFKAQGARVILGSPGCVGKRPNWSNDTNSTTEALNLNLCELRNIDIDIARNAQVRFADVFWPMLVGGHVAQQRYDPNYAIAGGDGVHPDWAGHLVMAYAFLHAMGLDGDIGAFNVDLKSNKARVSRGHELVSSGPGTWEIKSYRYPFCATGDVTKHNSIRSGMTLVPFNEELNRLKLVAKNGRSKHYIVKWGPATKSYSADQLAKGVNLADDFPINPFSESFEKMDKAVAAKQAYETKQVKQMFHGAEGKADMEATVLKTENEREKLVEGIKSAFVPVTHTIRIEPEQAR